MKIRPCYYAGDKMPWANSIVSGDFIFLSGAEGRDPNKKQEHPGFIEPPEIPTVEGIEAQTELTMMKIKERLEEAGASLKDIVVMNYFLTKRENWPKAMATLKKFCQKYCPDLIENPRCGTLLVNIGLARADMLIEIEVIAELPKKKRRKR